MAGESSKKPKIVSLSDETEPRSMEMRRLMRLERELFSNLSDQAERERKLDLALNADPALRAELRKEKDRSEALQQRALEAMLRCEMARKEVQQLKAQIEKLRKENHKLAQDCEFYQDSAQAWRDEVAVHAEVVEFLRAESDKMRTDMDKLQERKRKSKWSLPGR